MMANMDALWAEEVLRDHFGTLSGEQARILTLLATHGDEKAAGKAWTEATKREVWGNA